MVFEINSLYEVDDVVKTSNLFTATVLEVRLESINDGYRIRYLLEFENLERRWTNESGIVGKVEE